MIVTVYKLDIIYIKFFRNILCDNIGITRHFAQHVLSNLKLIVIRKVIDFSIWRIRTCSFQTAASHQMLLYFIMINIINHSYCSWCLSYVTHVPPNRFVALDI